MRHSFKWVLLFFFVIGCNSNVNNPKIPADQDIIDVAQISLTNALVNHDIPDYGLIADPKNIILEDTLLLPRYGASIRWNKNNCYVEQPDSRKSK